MWVIFVKDTHVYTDRGQVGRKKCLCPDLFHVCHGPGVGGKQFPDMRQKEREIKFIGVGDAVRRAGPLKGEPTLNRGP